MAEARAKGDWTLDRVSIGIFQGVKPDEWNINTSRIMGIDSTDSRSLTEGEIEGRRQVDEIFRFLKKYVPGCEDARLLCSGSTLGIRESRHIHGEKTLTLEDIIEGRTPHDSVLVCSNSADIHGRFGPKVTNMWSFKTAIGMASHTAVWCRRELMVSFLPEDASLQRQMRQVPSA